VLKSKPVIICFRQRVEVLPVWQAVRQPLEAQDTHDEAHGRAALQVWGVWPGVHTEERPKPPPCVFTPSVAVLHRPRVEVGV